MGQKASTYISDNSCMTFAEKSTRANSSIFLHSMYCFLGSTTLQCCFQIVFDARTFKLGNPDNEINNMLSNHVSLHKNLVPLNIRFIELRSNLLIIFIILKVKSILNIELFY